MSKLLQQTRVRFILFHIIMYLLLKDSIEGGAVDYSMEDEESSKETDVNTDIGVSF